MAETLSAKEITRYVEVQCREYRKALKNGDGSAMRECAESIQIFGARLEELAEEGDANGTP